MKTLANCTPAEFLSQGYKVIGAAKELLNDTKVLDIRKNLPDLTGEETPDEKNEKMRAQSKKNINDMLAVLMEKHPEKTAEVLGLVCFIDPEDLKNHKGIEFLAAAFEVLTSREVLDFFSSLTSLT